MARRRKLRGSCRPIPTRLASTAAASSKSRSYRASKADAGSASATAVAAAAAAASPRRLPICATGASEFKLPELGENISQGDLVRLMISPGTKVSEGQPVMELETDKAVVEVPSSVSGVVKEVKVKEGEKIKVGQVIFTLEGGAAPAPARSAHVRAGRARFRTARSASRISGGDSR